MTPAEEYWARPYSCKVRTRFFSGTFMFFTLEEAFAYAKQQWRVNENNEVAHPEYIGIRSDYRATVTDKIDDVNWSIFHELLRRLAMEQWKVTLLREPYLPNKTWENDRPRAFQRAYSLAELHNCTYNVINASKRIYVFAKAYYAPSKRSS
jgi:hypothetical protein